MSTEINIYVAKSYEPSGYVECLRWLVGSVLYTFLPEYDTYGWECGPTMNGTSMVLESKWAQDGDFGDPPEPGTRWSVFQHLIPGLPDGGMPIQWAATRGALNFGMDLAYDPENDPPIPLEGVTEGVKLMLGIYARGLVEGMCSGTAALDETDVIDTGVWGDRMIMQRGVAIVGGNIFPICLTVQLWDQSQVGWAGGGLYTPAPNVGIQTSVTQLDTKPIVNELKTISMSRLDISANNGSQMYSVKGGARQD